MQQLTAAPLVNDATGVFEVTSDCLVKADILTTLGGGVLVLQHSQDGTTWVATTIAGTAPTLVSSDIHEWLLPGGRKFRFLNDATVTATTIWVSGPHVNVNV